MRRVFVVVMILWLLVGIMALPAVARGPQEKAEKATGSVYLEQDVNVRYSEFAVFEATATKDVEGTYYWSRSDKGEFYGTITAVEVDPENGSAIFFGTTYGSSSTSWVANGCDFSVAIVDVGTPGAEGDTYHFTWEEQCGAIPSGTNRVYPVSGGNLVVHKG